MLRRRPSAGDHSALASAIDTLRRDGAATVTVEPLSDLSISEARYLRERWEQLPVDLRLGIVTNMALGADEDIRLNFERALVVGLQDDDPDVRLKATKALWEVESTHVLQSLLNRFPQEPVARVRVALADALGRYAGLVNDGSLRDDLRELTEQVLVTAAFVDTSEDVRLSALAAGAYLRPSQLEAAIIRTYDEGHDEAKEVALRAMGRFGGSRWATRVIDGLIRGDNEQRLEAALAAAYVEDRRVIPYLFEAAEDDEYPDLQLTAVRALGEIGGVNVQSFLEALRDSTTGNVSLAAESALENAALLEGEDEAATLY